jgi:hypothetical protein
VKDFFPSFPHSLAKNTKKREKKENATELHLKKDILQKEFFCFFSKKKGGSGETKIHFLPSLLVFQNQKEQSITSAPALETVYHDKIILEL